MTWVLAVANWSVCERVAREKSSKRSRTTYGPPMRPAARMRRATRSTRPMSTASMSGSVLGRRPPTTEIGIVPLLDRREKRVDVGVENRRLCHEHMFAQSRA